MRVATVTVFWNSLEGLTRLIPSIYRQFDAHVFIDGVYKNWPLTDEQKRGNGLSTDGSREYIKSWQDPIAMNVSLLDAPFKTEYEKRMMYLDAELLIRQLDVDAILIIDTDEYVSEMKGEYFYNRFESAIKRHRESWNVYGVMIQDQATEARQFESFQSYPHLWYHPWNMIYKPHSHYQYINYKRELGYLNTSYSQYPIEAIDGIKIIHDQTVRSKEYTENKNEYEFWLRGYEHELESRKFKS